MPRIVAATPNTAMPRAVHTCTLLDLGAVVGHASMHCRLDSSSNSGGMTNAINCDGECSSDGSDGASVSRRGGTERRGTCVVFACLCVGLSYQAHNAGQVEHRVQAAHKGGTNAGQPRTRDAKQHAQAPVALHLGRAVTVDGAHDVGSQHDGVQRCHRQDIKGREENDTVGNDGRPPCGWTCGGGQQQQCGSNASAGPSVRKSVKRRTCAASVLAPHDIAGL